MHSQESLEQLFYLSDEKNCSYFDKKMALVAVIPVLSLSMAKRDEASLRREHLHDELLSGSPRSVAYDG